MILKDAEMASLCVNPVDAMVYDDEESCRKFLTGILRKVYGVENIETENNILSLSIDLAINRPRVLILDYMYSNGLDLPFVAPMLSTFKGLGIIYSSIDKRQLEKEVGPLPYNFFFIQKGDFKHLRRVLDSALVRV